MYIVDITQYYPTVVFVKGTTQILYFSPTVFVINFTGHFARFTAIV